MKKVKLAAMSMALVFAVASAAPAFASIDEPVKKECSKEKKEECTKKGKKQKAAKSESKECTKGEKKTCCSAKTAE